MVMLEDLGADSADTHRAAGVYAAFLDHAFVAETGRFRNFLGYDRRWLDAGGSDDCLGRAVLALGACVGRSRRPGLARWAMRLFAPAVRAAQAATSPRAWALAIVGIQEYLRRLDGDRLAASLRRDLTARLIDCAGATATPDWPWLEDSVTYDNGRLCQALIVSGRWTGDARPLDTGLRMLAWLVEGSGRPSTSNRWRRRPWWLPASRRSTPPATGAGWSTRGTPSNGSAATTCSASGSATRGRGAVATGCSWTAPTRTRGRSRPSPGSGRSST
jgi:hypothetical protein